MNARRLIDRVTEGRARPARLVRALCEAGGQDVGKLEIAHTDLAEARKFAEDLFRKWGKELDEEIPNFDKNYAMAQKACREGWTQRKDMPVITSNQVRTLQKVLKKGYIDINPPFAPATNDEPDVDDPFPQGLDHHRAQFWLTRGMRDGNKLDDVIEVDTLSEKVSKLKPIQKQIYFDKSIEGIAKGGRDKSLAFYRSALTITSSDLYIIDGHHRWAGTFLLDPNTVVQGIKIDLPIDKLLPLTLAYGDAIGNQRNA